MKFNINWFFNKLYLQMFSFKLLSGGKYNGLWGTKDLNSVDVVKVENGAILIQNCEQI